MFGIRWIVRAPMEVAALIRHERRCGQEAGWARRVRGGVFFNRDFLLWFAVVSRFVAPLEERGVALAP